jgi:hypothetical protein
MTYENFYDIAMYGNKEWKGFFTDKEIACNAYDYLVEYEASKEAGKPTNTMLELCRLLLMDSDLVAFTGIHEVHDLDEMEKVLEGF